MKTVKKLFAFMMCAIIIVSSVITTGAVGVDSGFRYDRIDNSDVVEILGISPYGELAEAQTVTIPYSIRGLAVIQIGKSAFMGNNTIQCVNMTPYILEISESAMSNMKALKSVVIPPSLKILGKRAFAFCSNLESVEFQTGSLEQMPEYAFHGCTKLNNVILPEGLYELEDYCFSQCMSLDKIYIPSSVAVISASAFNSVKKGFTIYGYRNTAAEYYAAKYELPFVDMTEKSLDGLSQSINKADNIIDYADSSLYTEETFNSFAVAYESALAVKEDFFSTPADVETAKTELNNAYNSLRLKSMDNLDTLITQAEDKMSVSFKYTEASVSSLEEALHQAKNVQNSTPATETQVQNAIQNLSTSINALETITQTDTRAILKGCSSSLEGDIALNFYMQLDSGVIGSETAYMQFTIPKGENNTEIQKVFVKDAKLRYVNGEALYVFKCRIAPKEIGLRVKAQLVDGDSQATEYNYSVKDYAYYMLAHKEIAAYARAEGIVKAMLNHGAYAQMYFDGASDRLVNDNMTENEKDVSDITAQTINKPYNKNTQNFLCDGVVFRGATLSLQSETTLSLYFQSEETLSFSCPGKILSVTKKDGFQILRISGIASKEIGSDFTVTVTVGENSGTLTYNPLNYCYDVLNNSSNGISWQNSVKALYKYWQAANIYFQ